MSTVKFTAAFAATVSPWWLPAVKGVSEIAAVCLPILGCTWMVIQIVGYFLKRKS